MVVILMGVSGSGKTTIGKLLATELGCSFVDADDFHPEANIKKMSSGIPLTDKDRWPWLHAVRKFIEDCLHENRSVIIACSALKQTYRDILTRDRRGEVRFVYLRGDFDLIKNRLADRKGHFFDAELLQAQFADLEEPRDALCVDIAQGPKAIVKQIRTALLDRHGPG